jgi:hypothetical protein
MPTTWDKIQVWFRGPEWQPSTETVVEQPFPPEGRGYDMDTPKAYYFYIWIQYLPVAVATTMLLTFDRYIPYWIHGVAASLLVFTMVSWSSFFEQKKWAFGAEFARLSLLSSLGIILTRHLNDTTTGLAIIGFAILSGLYLLRCQQEEKKADTNL